MAGICCPPTTKRLAEKLQRVARLAVYLGITFLLGMLSLSLVACQSADVRGAATKERVVDIYLRALENQDVHAILLLTPPTHIAEQAARAKVEEFGGHTLHNVQVGYLSEFGPRMAQVTVKGMRIGSNNEHVEFKDQIYLRQIEGRWYLILGQHREGLPATISPSVP